MAAQVNLTVKRRFRVRRGNGGVAKQWCLDGQGIMLRSRWNVQPALNSGQLINVLAQYSQPADVYAIYPARLETSAKLRVVVNLLEQGLANINSGRGNGNGNGS
ncbi:LysR substrate-binding domain-containing protein [Amphritea sp. 1_MG-2023]|uniref:LysR substrate-binding domain-containing protein n=1 Tax=Amphritea sp. 1_MG-2023 TaxID=3062670 RepID=UPI0026E20478|nr:LysR substrate-binding domain-containing protein [Amphritea sp. 1_MG-2023]MDO6563596.1 LysR substrate-binding domain-containing protein [Amphritea sp. 1_MG-2023]